MGDGTLRGIAELIATLPLLERRCLAVLASLGAPSNRTQLAARLREAAVVRERTIERNERKYGRRSQSGNAVSTSDLAPMLKRWTQQGLTLLTTAGGELCACTPEAAHAVLSDPACRSTLEQMRRALVEVKGSFAPREYGYEAVARKLRVARLALYCGEPAEADRMFALAKQGLYATPGFDAYGALLHPRAPAAALQLMSGGLQLEYLEHTLANCVTRLLVPSAGMLAAAVAFDRALAPTLRPHAVMLAAISGEARDAESWLAGDTSSLALEARAVLALQRGDFDSARALAVLAFTGSQGKSSRKQPQLSGPLAPLLTLALATGAREQVAIARAQLSRVTRKGRIAEGYAAIAVLLREGGARRGIRSTGDDPLELLCFGLVVMFLGEGVPTLLGNAIARLHTACTRGGAHWLAAQAQALALQLKAAGDPLPEVVRAFGGVLLEMHRPQAAWERALMLLESLQPSDTRALPPVADVQATAERRLVFLVRQSTRELPLAGRHYDPDDDLDAEMEAELDDWEADEFDSEPSDASAAPALQNDCGSDEETVTEVTLGIEPRLQTRKGNGFTAGRPVALRTLAEPTPDVDYLTPEDLRVTARISSQKTWSGRDHYFAPRAALALVGHPRVFWADQPTGPAIEVVMRPATLRVDRGPNGLRLRVEPFANAAGIGVMVDGEGRLVVCELSLAQLNVQRAALELPPIPADGEARLRQILGRMASLFTIQSQVGVDGLEGALEELPTDSRPVVQLVRAEPGLRVRVSVAPLGAAGPSFKPGEGLATVATDLAGRRVHCQRSLSAERQALDTLLEAAPLLRAALGGVPLHIDTLPDCCALLQTLSTLADTVLVHWPEGKPLAVVAEAELSSLRLSIGERGGWLLATGTLRVDETQVLDILQALAQRTVGGAYVALGDDRYLALSRDLQQQLSALETAASTSTRDKSTRDKTGEALRLPPIALGFVSPWLKLLRAAGGLKVDARTQAQLARILHAYETTPELPKTFEAELRSYQVTGYEFLARLADIGAGACLADDMGLGKTLMALALLVSRAVSGPSLVITPTSVRANWFDEALRYAPTLRMRRLEGAEGVALEALEPFDVLVCSYTVMALRIEQLERTRFATLVLDEAQSIKNGATQRAQAARRLVADARVALTGTPVENHLGDLHGIMSFLNPGLLGDARYFETRFGKPIQRDGDAKAREQLRALIAPFLLRRRKSEVLRELPARTEITLRVEPEAPEQAFSEALRRAALVRLRESDAARAGSAVSILAEITRLRRAACHPQLIDANTNVGGVKLERLVELALELRDGGHRALVFSQFVDFLQLVRARLVSEGLTCQYLDGSTSEPARKKAVTAFQSGEGDLFLISLKAGGFGLNLTAADYVIHLDPWWNPAVEAQASDRAHRIGQERPVTIYRLVNAASIEERVLALHEQKQALAEDLLRDSAEATRLDPKALMALLES